MSKINSKIKDDFQVVLLLSCFVGHPVIKYNDLKLIKYNDLKIIKYNDLKIIKYNDLKMIF